MKVIRIGERWHPYTSYKDSGVRWLKEIPSHWNLRKLKHIASIWFSNVDKHTKDGEDPVRLCNYVDVYHNEYIIADLDFMEATASYEEIKRFTLKESDVIITKDSETWEDIAVAAYVPTDIAGVLCGYHLAVIHPRHDATDGRYLFRSFSASGINDQFRVAASGITRYGLGKYWLENSFFFEPPLPEQRAIANFLDRETTKIDTLIEKKQRLVELLHEKRIALINHAVTRGLDPTVTMKDSGVEWLGEIPENWKLERNKHLFYEVNKRSITGEEELLTVSHITGVTRRSEKDVNMFMAETLEGYKICKPGELVINTMWAWMGALGISPHEGVVSPSYNVYHLRESNSLVPKYLDYLYRTNQHIMEINRYSKGVWSSRLRLYPDEFYQMITPIPPYGEQCVITAFLDRENAKIDELKSRIELAVGKLKEYRTALISAAVTGKIDVRESVS